MTTFHSADVSPSQHALRAIEAAAGGKVRACYQPNFVKATAPAPERIVALVSGGGAGHEPMHANFVGRGGLDAAVPGEVFTSPHSRQIHAASQAVARDSGVLHIVKNYTGDVINFGIAAERLKSEGIFVRELIVDDDLGTDSGDEDGPGRRGTAATVIVEKILGAAADRGLGLQQLKDYGQAIVDRTRSLAVARAAHTPPGGTEPGFDVEEGKLEYGVGIHGETARERIDQPPLQELVDRMVGELLDALPEPEVGVIVLVNGLGGVAPLELAHVSIEAERALRDRDVPIRSIVSGNFITALDMAGFSLTLTAIEDQWMYDWLAPHDTVGLPTPRPWLTPPERDAEAPVQEAKEASVWLRSFVDELQGMEKTLNKIDQKAGDGDVGTNMAGAAKAALAHASGADASLARDLRSIAEGFLSDTGGSSGPLFGLVMQEIAAAAEAGENLLDGVRAGMEAVTRVGGAKPGDRTIVDALDAAVGGADQLDQTAVGAAIDGTEATAEMVGLKGRSSYLGDRVLGVPDPGAISMAMVLLLVAEGASAERLDPERKRIAGLLDD